MKNIYKRILLVGSIIFSLQLQAQVGYLDPTFGDSGIVIQKRLGITEGLAVLTDGKILVAGGSGPNFYMDRFLPDGKNDLDFGINGRVELNLENKEAHCKDMVVQGDGKIILVGSIFNTGPYFDIAVARCNPDGSLDSSFGSNGLVRVDLMNYDYGYGVALQSDGKILVTGNTTNSTYVSQDAFIIRLNTDGSLDASFANAGILQEHYPVYIDFSRVMVQPDGKILMGGSYNTYASKPDYMVKRFNTDGSLDNSFGDDGTAKFKFGEGEVGDDWWNNLRDIALQPDGKIVCVGQTGYDFPRMAICRFNSDGNIDTDFGQQGGFYFDYYGHWSQFYAVCIQPDNKILVTGVAYGSYFIGPIVLSRFETDGSFDQSFGVNGIQATYSNETMGGDEITLLSNQKILVAGSYGDGQIVLARYNGDNVLATHFKNVQAIQDKESITISWQTLNESGTKNYSIERSSNATDFTSIATVPAKGGQENSYSYTDHHPLEGTSYYRIKENALNGTATFSNTLKVIFESNTISLYPNPAKNTITITGLNKQYNATIRITDMHGRELLNQKINNSSNITLPIRVLAQGSYFILIEQNGKAEKLRFVKE